MGWGGRCVLNELGSVTTNQVGSLRSKGGKEKGAKGSELGREGLVSQFGGSGTSGDCQCGEFGWFLSLGWLVSREERTQAVARLVRCDAAAFAFSLIG